MNVIDSEEFRRLRAQQGRRQARWPVPRRQHEQLTGYVWLIGWLCLAIALVWFGWWLHAHVGAR